MGSRCPAGGAVTGLLLPAQHPSPAWAVAPSTPEEGISTSAMPGSLLPAPLAGPLVVACVRMGLALLRPLHAQMSAQPRG